MQQEWEIINSTLKGWTLYMFHNPFERILSDTFVEVYSPDRILDMSLFGAEHEKKGLNCYFNKDGKAFCESKLAEMKVVDFMVYLSEVIPNKYSRYSCSNLAKRRFEDDIVKLGMCSLPVRIKRVDGGVNGLQNLLRGLVVNGITDMHYVPDADFVCRR